MSAMDRTQIGCMQGKRLTHCPFSLDQKQCVERWLAGRPTSFPLSAPGTVLQQLHQEARQVVGTEHAIQGAQRKAGVGSGRG